MRALGRHTLPRGPLLLLVLVVLFAASCSDTPASSGSEDPNSQASERPAPSAVVDEDLTDPYADYREDLQEYALLNGLEGDLLTEEELRQLAWEDQEGQDWEDFSIGYEDGFNSGCDDMFGVSPNGSLYYDDVEYSSLDCQFHLGDASDADYPSFVPFDPVSEGEDVGYEAGCAAVFEEELLEALFYGDQGFDADDCGAAGVSVAPPAPQPAPPPPPAASQGCYAEAVEFIVESGNINCAGAVALWIDYVSRRSTEGQGSSAAVELYGWFCGSASAASVPRLGSCTKIDSGDAFTVYSL